MGLTWDVFDSPLGQLKMCSDGTYLTALIIVGQKYGEKHISQAERGTCPVLEQTKVWLSEYFDGNIPHDLPPLKPAGTPFQLRVWDALLQISYGQTISYGQLAKVVGCKSAQAVGSAVGKNPISILIPCHRVIGADGSLVGYAGGLDKKKALLDTERKGGNL